MGSNKLVDQLAEQIREEDQNILNILKELSQKQLLMDTLNKVKQFHEIFRHPIKNTIDITDEKVNELRVKLLREELDELEEGLENRDPVRVLDALSDLQYVLDGAYLSFGMQNLKIPAFNEVHDSNMTKLEDGKPLIREDGKILKGKDYRPPNLVQFVKENSDE